VTSDQTLISYSVPSLSVTQQIVGSNDEVIDATFLSTDEPSAPAPRKETHLALATNSASIRLYSLAENTFDTQLLDAHSDIVLCLASGLAPSAEAGPSAPRRTMLISGSKDRSARIWLPAPTTSSWSSVAMCTGHLEAVGAVALPRRPDSLFCLTASQDRTIKLWDLSPLSSGADGQGELKLGSLVTQKIHDRDINTLDISPDDRLIASGSQDKTAKVFSVDVRAGKKGKDASASLTLQVVLKGHKRGVWSVKFSDRDRVVATASGDRTVKLWSVEGGDCLKVRGFFNF
jgi:U3 small nucleolar RNA-associated protein 13